MSSSSSTTVVNISHLRFIGNGFDYDPVTGILAVSIHGAEDTISSDDVYIPTSAFDNIMSNFASSPTNSST